MDELQKIIQRYERRAQNIPPERYNILNPAVYMKEFEKERAIIKMFNRVGLNSLGKKRLLEIGCGKGNNLLQFIRFGFSPELIIGNELLPERAKIADEITPASLKILRGNALELDFKDETFDVIYQSEVFSSILDDDFTKALAQKIWRMLKSDGGILWYDFIYNNPFNKDVRGIPFKKIKELFPQARIVKKKISLIPPLARAITKIDDHFYNMLNILTIMRSYLLCWIAKN